METELIIHHIDQMLRQLNAEPLRAAYMVVQQLYALQKEKEKVDGTKIIQ